MDNGKFLKSLQIVGRWVLTPYFMKSPYVFPTSLFQSLSNSSSPTLPCYLQSSPPLFGQLWKIWIYTCRFFVVSYQKDLDVCFMQQGIKFTELWHVVFFTGALIWCHSDKYKQNTPGSVDWHTWIIIYWHPLFCAHSNYFCYIKLLNE